MSTDQTPTPDDIVIPPSLEETEQAIQSIDVHDGGIAGIAALALKTLARSVIDSVERTDRSHNVSRFLTKLEIVVTGEGMYQLCIYERNTGVDVQQIAQEIADSMAAGDFGKRLRPIQLEFNAHGQ